MSSAPNPPGHRRKRGKEEKRPAGAHPEAERRSMGPQLGRKNASQSARKQDEKRQRRQGTQGSCPHLPGAGERGTMDQEDSNVLDEKQSPSAQNSQRSCMQQSKSPPPRWPRIYGIRHDSVVGGDGPVAHSDVLDVPDLVLASSCRELHGDFVASRFADQGSRQGSGYAEAPFIDVSLVGPHDLVANFFPGIEVR